MKHNFDRSLRSVLELEGAISKDKLDPGNTNKDGSAGFTVWGLASRYNPEVTQGMSIEQAAIIYKTKYWGKVCNDLPFPLDLIVFDICVNQGPGTLKTLVGDDLHAWADQFTWQDLLFKRMLYYKGNSKDIFVKGHLFRVLKLYQMILDW